MKLWTICLAWMLMIVVGSAQAHVVLVAVEDVGVHTTFIQGEARPGALVTVHGPENHHQETRAAEDGTFAFYDLPLVFSENRFLVEAEWDGTVHTAVHWVRSQRPSLLGAGLLSVDVLYPLDGSGYQWHWDGQGALYGDVAGYSLAVAADSEGELSRSGEGFPGTVYGDHSKREQLGYSSLPIYLKLETEERSLLVGDFHTDFLQQGELTNYRRALAGAHLHWSQGPLQLDIVRSTADRRPFAEVLPGKGVSGFYHLTYAPVLTHSETVSLLTRDRDDRSKVVDMRMLTRGEDYTIDYRLGMIHFTKPVPVVDSLANPVFVSVSYEYAADQGGVVTGGSTALTSRWAVLSGTAVREGEFLFGSVQLRSPQQQRHRLRVEAALSDDGEVGSGTAYLVGYDGRLHDSVTASLVVRTQDPEFANNPGASTGLTQTQREAAVRWNPASWTVRAEGQQRHWAGEQIDQQQDSWTLDVKREIGSAAVESGLSTVLRTDNDQADRTSSLWLGTQYAISEKTSISAKRTQRFGADALGQWTLSLHRALADRINSRGSYTRIDGGESLASLSFDTEIGEERSTKLTTSHHLRHTEDQWSLGSSQGMASSVSFGSRTDVHLFLQHRRDSGTASYYSGAVGWEYLFANLAHRVEGKLETGTGEDTLHRLMHLALEGRAFRGLSYRGSLHWAENQLAPDDIRNRQTAFLSLAYRPLWVDRYGALAFWRYDRFDGHDVSTVAVEGTTVLADRAEVGVKLALRSTEGETHYTMLQQVRTAYRVTKHWDLAGSVRRLTQPVSESRRLSWSTGVGYRVVEDGGLRVEVGYKSDGYDGWADDPSRVVQHSTAGPYVRLTVAF